MKKITLIILSFLLIVLLSGCFEKTKISTAPWNNKQIEKMKETEVETIPILIIEY